MRCPLDRPQLRALLRAQGLDRVAEPLLAFARDSIALERTPSLDSAVPIGATKLGGAPDLPVGVDWPTHAGVPYAFLCQVACAEAAPLDPTGLLPQSGMLCFFVLLTEENYWDFPLVLYHDSMALQRAPLPTWPPGATSTADTFFAELVFPTCAVTLVRDVTLADGAAARVQAVGMTEAESTRYWELSVQSGPAGLSIRRWAALPTEPGIISSATPWRCRASAACPAGRTTGRCCCNSHRITMPVSAGETLVS
jgi:hypothetical protein